ncbi:hypothetical protein [Duncaniella dubosii]|uniref:hypothetical protein n=1 Tax=Duncaniella dubosii TaxID=2518971 RepID=UPI003F68003E
MSGNFVASLAMTSSTLKTPISCYLGQEAHHGNRHDINKFFCDKPELPVLVLGVVEVLRCSLFAWGVGEEDKLNNLWFEFPSGEKSPA